MKRNLIIVRGGGDIATGTIAKLHNCGYAVLVLETKNPSAIRRYVAFSEAVYEKEYMVEGITCKCTDTFEEALRTIEEGNVAIMVDPDAEVLEKAKPAAVVDAILAKKNLGTNRMMAPFTVGLGPGFTAGSDVDVVIETMRGHHLGRILYRGSAMENTGVPGAIAGVSKERVIHASTEGIIYGDKNISDYVEKGEQIAHICKRGNAADSDDFFDIVSAYQKAQEEAIPVYATISGILRGLIRDGYPVTEGFKIADIDPRKSEFANCFSISDKARCIAGGVLEALMQAGIRPEQEEE